MTKHNNEENNPCAMGSIGNKDWFGEAQAEKTAQIKREVIELLWDYLPRDPKHKDRRKTGWGTKTQIGLVACIERITAGE